MCVTPGCGSCVENNFCGSISAPNTKKLSNSRNKRVKKPTQNPSNTEQAVAVNENTNSKKTGTSCSDVNCSGCEGKHDNTARNIFLSIGAVLIVAMIGYLIYVKMRAKRPIISKSFLPTDTKSETIEY